MISRLLMTKPRRCSSSPGAAVSAEGNFSDRCGRLSEMAKPRSFGESQNGVTRPAGAGALFLCSSGESAASSGLPAFVRNWRQPSRATLGSRCCRSSRITRRRRRWGVPCGVSFALVPLTSLPGRVGLGRVGGPGGPRHAEEPRTHPERSRHKGMVLGKCCSFKCRTW